MTGSISTTAVIPPYITDWFHQLKARSLAQVIPEPATGALFCVDMLIGFCKVGALASERINALVKPVTDLFQQAYAYGIHHFVLLQDTHNSQTPEFMSYATHCVRGTDEVQTIPELKQLHFASDFTVIEKNSLNPSIGTEFDYWLAGHPEVQTAIVIGNCTDLCVYQLAMHMRLRANALNLADFQVIVPANTVATYDLSGEAAKKIGADPHPGDFFHRVFLYHMMLNGVQVVRELCQQSGRE